MAISDSGGARRFGTVVFDCDSTLSRVEGIEELAALRGVNVEALTEAAMRGDVPLEAVYGRRLELADPTRADVEAVGRRYVETLVPDARDAVRALQKAGVEVRILSGGLRPAVLALAVELAIDPAAVAAVDVRFDDSGRYVGYDTASPLARSGGKPEILREWLPTLRPPLMLVGDGATDLEAAPVVDLFVAFAGVVDRAEVTAGAGAVIRTSSLAPVVTLALGPTPPDDPFVRGVWERGRELMART